MTDDQIYTVFQQIIMDVTGLAGTNVIPADDNHQAPSGAYASIKVGQSRGQRGHANQILKNTALVSSPIGMVRDVEHDIRPQVTNDISVNFYRGAAGEYASALFQANKRPDVSQALFQAGIGWRNANAINDLTALQSNEMEQRAQITITVWYEQSQKVVTNAIYSTSITVENENNDTIQTETIDSPVGV